MYISIINEIQSNPLVYIAENARICTNRETFNPSMYNSTEIKEKALDTCESLLNRGHLSVFECIYIEWYIRDISRACANQLVRHRMASYLQQSQRYVNYKESDEFWNKMVLPELSYITNSGVYEEAIKIIKSTIEEIKENYKKLNELGIKAEDARAILPQCSPTTMKIGMNLREFLFNFYPLRSSKHAQQEIRTLANKMLDTIKAKFSNDNHFKLFLKIYLRWLEKHKELRNEWK